MGIRRPARIAAALDGVQAVCVRLHLAGKYKVHRPGELAFLVIVRRGVHRGCGLRDGLAEKFDMAGVFGQVADGHLLP